MLHEQAALATPTLPANVPPKPFFDEAARLNPLMSVEAFRAATPLFNYETRQIAELQQDRRTQRRMFRRSILKELRNFAILWAFLLFLSGGAEILSGQISGGVLLGYIVGDFFGAAVITFGLTFLSSLLLEFSCLSLRVKPGEEWDLIRITPLSRRGIIVTFYAFNRFYHRRSMRSIFTNRLIALYGIFLLAAVILYLVTHYLGIELRDVLYAIYPNHLARVVVPLVIVAEIAVLLLFEIRWRVNGMSALGTALALWMIGSDLAVLVRVVALMGTWIGQVALMVASWWIGDGIVDWFRQRQLQFRFFAERDGWGIEPVVLQILFACVIFEVLLYIYFRVMRFVGLRLAYWGILRNG